MLPADYDGRRLPPGKAPNCLMLHEETNANGAPREFHADFANTAQHELHQGRERFPVPAFDDNMCNFVRNCIPQKSTSTDEQARRGSSGAASIHRLAYRNNGSYPRLVVAHTVDTVEATTPACAGTELRKTGSKRLGR